MREILGDLAIEQKPQNFACVEQGRPKFWASPWVAGDWRNLMNKATLVLRLRSNLRGESFQGLEEY
jgi:hypothetical protein